MAEPGPTSNHPDRTARGSGNVHPGHAQRIVTTMVEVHATARYMPVAGAISDDWWARTGIKLQAGMPVERLKAVSVAVPPRR